MKAVALFALLFLIPASYLTYKVWSFDPNVPIKGSNVQASVFNESVAVATAYWRSRGVGSPCSKIRGTVLSALPFPNQMKDAGAREGVCEILFRRGWYRLAKDDPPRFCTVVTHESGHIFGRVHVADPADIMYTPTHRILPACRVL